MQTADLAYFGKCHVLIGSIETLSASRFSLKTKALWLFPPSRKNILPNVASPNESGLLAQIILATAGRNGAPWLDGQGFLATCAAAKGRNLPIT
jgi:hypothetical protein